MSKALPPPQRCSHLPSRVRRDSKGEACARSHCPVRGQGGRGRLARCTRAVFVAAGSRDDVVASRAPDAAASRGTGKVKMDCRDWGRASTRLRYGGQSQAGGDRARRAELARLRHSWTASLGNGRCRCRESDARNGDARVSVGVKAGLGEDEGSPSIRRVVRLTSDKPTGH